MSSNNSTSAEHAFRWGIEVTPDEPVVDLAQLAARAEAAGFGAAFVSNHYNNRDPFVALAHMAAATETIRLGPGVVNPYETHPATLASAASTLDEASNGRALFGIGAGDRSTLTALGISQDRPVARVEEAIHVARALWAGEAVDHDGTFATTAARLSYATGQLPVYVGGQGPQMIRLAAAVGDGLLANASHPADYEWITTQVDRGTARRPSELGRCSIAAFASVSVASTEHDAVAAARPPVAFIAAGAPDRVIDRHSIDRTDVSQVRDTLAAGERAAAYELVTRPMIDAFCVAGTPETVTERLTAIGAYADAIVAGSPLGPDRTESIRLLGEVRNRLQHTGVFTA